jgi:hypothetical protein
MGNGVHGAALASLLAGDLLSAANVEGQGPRVYDLKPRAPHFAPKAKAVIQLFQNGGPSHVDLFDYKPALQKMAGTPPSRDIVNEIEFADQVGTVLPSPFQFARHGKCGMEMSELLPHLAECADDITLIRSMYGEHFNHEPALYLMHTGRTLPGRPSLGAWVTYGLGTENQNLPAYVVLDDPKHLPVNGIQNWQAGWLPPVYQGTRFRSEGPPLLNLKPPEELPSALVEAQRALARRLQASHRQSHPGYPDVDARITTFELAARMQLSATDALDLSQESDQTKEMYGLNQEATASYGKRCLMARRLVERGVRFVQVWAGGWDHHQDIETRRPASAAEIDIPAAALLTDLKQRGLLDSTLIIWGGEFGRTVTRDRNGNDNPGRDHNNKAFSVWLAGGGVKGGTVYGVTDSFGAKAIENKVQVHDLHATILQLLGFDHTRLTYRYSGKDYRLTDNFGEVVKGVLA